MKKAVRCMGARELFEIFDQLSKDRSRRHDPAFRRLIAREEIDSFGEIKNRQVLINYINDVYKHWSYDGATRFGALMFP